MKAVVMAGGEGSRLRPLTSLRPKPMVPIVNQPIMEHIIGLLKHHDITDAVATLAFMPRFIEDYFGNGEEWGMNLSYAVEETPLGTAGSVKNAEHLLRDGTFLVISGDALTDIDLTSVIEFHRKKRATVTIALKSVPDPLDFGVVITDADGRIERFLEKPTWGQVFSDTINTGIYVMEPEVFDFIPQGEAFDFSSQLFPLLMEKGYGLYGFHSKGYWCDVGSLESYVQAHRDLMSGKANLYIPGISVRDGLWIGEGARIDADAVLGEHVVVGKNVTIRSGAVIGDFTVLGDNCVIGTDAKVTHSVIWSDTFIGRNSDVQGSVLCRGVDIRGGASVASGAVLGDEVTVGHRAHINTDVQVYPYKTVEPGAVASSSIIWEATGARTLFGERGISGIVGVDLSPEMALRIAQAYGSLLPKGSHVMVSRDSSRSSRMIKRAMIAGLNSAGCHVRDLRVCSPAMNRLTTRDTRCLGGVHVCQSATDVQAIEIHIFDRLGLDIAAWEEKKIERLYHRGEFRRTFFSDVGDVTFPPRTIEYYSSALETFAHSINTDDTSFKVVADLAGGVASFVLPQVFVHSGIDLVSINPFLDAERTFIGTDQSEEFGELSRLVQFLGADLGVAFDTSGERLTLLTPSGKTLDGATSLFALVDLWCKYDESGLPVAVPSTVSRVAEKIAAITGHSVIRPGRSRRSLAQLAANNSVSFAGGRTGGYIFPSFLAGYDGVASLVGICALLAKDERTLDEIVAQLPPYFAEQTDIFCPSTSKGKVMRSLTEETGVPTADITEGIQVEYDDGWILVLPHSSEPHISIFAEADTIDRLKTLTDKWTQMVEASI